MVQPFLQYWIIAQNQILNFCFFAQKANFLTSYDRLIIAGRRLLSELFPRVASGHSCYIWIWDLDKYKYILIFEPIFFAIWPNALFHLRHTHFTQRRPSSRFFLSELISVTPMTVQIEFNNVSHHSPTVALVQFSWT